MGFPFSAGFCEGTESFKKQKIFGVTGASFECPSLNVPVPFLGDAAVLNNVAHTFGLMDTIKKVLDNRKNQTEQGEEQFLYTLAGKVPNKGSPPAAALGNGHDFPSTQPQ